MRELYQMVIAELRGSWRFRWLTVAAAWVICLIGWAVVYAIPDEYESKATVLFDTTSELDELLESLTVSADPLTRIETVRTALLSTAQLEKVLRETDLHLLAGSDSELRGLVGTLRSSIDITSDRRRGANLYEISFRYEEADVAQSVVATLLDAFVEDTLGANREGTQRAQKFLREQIDTLEASLTEAEERLADFKRNNVGRMPGESGDYFQRLQSTMNALELTRTELRQANRQRETLNMQLAGEQPTMQQSGVRSEIDQRIWENEKRLEELQLRFTERHPDVIAVGETLEQLRNQKQQQLDALRDSTELGVVSDNPVFQNIQIELSKVNVLIASLEEQERTQLRSIAELEELVDVLPQVEAELARLNRDYDVTQSQYRSLLQRLDVAELSESAEQSENVDFQIIEPPTLPTRPAAPNRPLFLAAVLFVALGAGGGAAFLGNQLNPVFIDPKSIRQATGLPVLGTVQVLQTRERRRRRFVQLGSFAFSVSLLCVFFVAAVVLNEPGSELARSLLDRL